MSLNRLSKMQTNTKLVAGTKYTYKDKFGFGSFKTLQTYIFTFIYYYDLVYSRFDYQIKDMCQLFRTK